MVLHAALELFIHIHLCDYIVSQFLLWFVWIVSEKSAETFAETLCHFDDKIVAETLHNNNFSINNRNIVIGRENSRLLSTACRSPPAMTVSETNFHNESVSNFRSFALHSRIRNVCVSNAMHARWKTFRFEMTLVEQRRKKEEEKRIADLLPYHLSLHICKQKREWADEHAHEPQIHPTAIQIYWQHLLLLSID